MSKYRNIKIHVPTPEISEAVQKKLFEDGCCWVGFNQDDPQYADSQYLHVLSCGRMAKADCKTVFISALEKEVSYQSILDPYYDVKIAWANGEGVQYRIKGADDWFDWELDNGIAISDYEEWRIKPKTKTIKQWERKYHVNGVVYTMIIADKNDDKDVDTWIGDAYEVEYEVPND